MRLEELRKAKYSMARNMRNIERHSLESSQSVAVFCWGYFAIDRSPFAKTQ